MKLKILSFGGEAFSSETVSSVTLMTAIGEITVLDDHAPLLTSIKPSTLYVVYKDEHGLEKREDFAVGSGVVEVSDSSVKVMADMLVDIDSLDVDQAQKAREEALALMEKYRDAKDRIDMEKFVEAEDMLLKSIAQLKLGNIK